MFSSIRQGNLFYILTKGGDKPTLKIGQVESASAPVQKYPTFNPNPAYNMQAEMLVDIKVKCGDEILDFQKLPANMEVFSYTNPNTVVSDRREAIISEIETMMQTSKQIIESVPYHQSVVESCDEMLKSLNPQFAKEKIQEEKISALEDQVKGIKGDLGDIKSLLMSMKGGNTPVQERNNSKPNKN